MRPTRLRVWRRGDQSYWVASVKGRKVVLGNRRTISRRDAQTALDRKIATAFADRPSGELTVRQLCDRYVAWSCVHRSPQSARNRKSALQQFAAWYGPDRLARAVTRRDIDRYADTLGGLAPKTIELRRQLITACWTWAADLIA